MNRNEALRLLCGGRAGIETWNRRRGAGEEIPDLCEAKLGGAFLIGADLHGADLYGADLHGAELVLATLSQAILRKADLRGAQLFKTDLSRADLCWADLSEATLGADLSGAKLGEPGVEANFSRVRCISTVFVDVDLSWVKGLDLVEHLGPSEISVSTLVRRGDRSPRCSCGAAAYQRL